MAASRMLTRRDTSVPSAIAVKAAIAAMNGT